MSQSVRKSHCDTALCQAFDTYDTKGDGTIDREEFEELVYSLGSLEFTAARMDEWFKKADIDNKGRVDQAEFLKMAPLMETLSSWMDAFRVFDHNKDGYITKQELKTVVHGQDVKLAIAMADGCIDKLIAQMDENGDGKINYKEFMNSSLSPAMLYNV